MKRMQQRAIALNKGDDGVGALGEAPRPGVGTVAQFFDRLLDAHAKLRVNSRLVVDYARHGPDGHLRALRDLFNGNRHKTLSIRHGRPSAAPAMKRYIGNVNPNLAKVNGPGERRPRGSENSRVGLQGAGRNGMLGQARGLESRIDIFPVSCYCLPSRHEAVHEEPIRTDVQGG